MGYTHRIKLTAPFVNTTACRHSYVHHISCPVRTGPLLGGGKTTAFGSAMGTPQANFYLDQCLYTWALVESVAHFPCSSCVFWHDQGQEEERPGMFHLEWWQELYVTPYRFCHSCTDSVTAVHGVVVITRGHSVRQLPMRWWGLAPQTNLNYHVAI